MTKQTIKNILIIICLIMIALIFLSKKDGYFPQESFEGEIYNNSSSKLLEKQENTNILKEEKEAEKASLIDDKTKSKEIFLLFTAAENIPEDFSAKKTLNIDMADFVIITKSDYANLQKTTSKNPTKTASGKAVNTAKKTAQPKVAKQKSEKLQPAAEKEKNNELPDIKEENFNYAILNDLIKKSRLTFFYADNFKNISDVSVGVFSITPYKNYHLIKFQVKNNSLGYFFISSVGLSNKEPIICKNFYDNMVAKGRILEGIILAPKQNKNDKLTFNLNESGNKERSYQINIKIP